MTASICRSVRKATRFCITHALMTGRIAAHGEITLLLALDSGIKKVYHRLERMSNPARILPRLCNEYGRKTGTKTEYFRYVCSLGNVEDVACEANAWLC